MAKSQLALMTWREAEEAFRANPVLIIPSGSIEQHGPQTPVGDFQLGQVIGERIAAGSGALLAPMLPYGYSDVFRGFPGTVSLQADTIFNVMYDVAVNFIEHGLDHIVFMCGHHGNMPILEQVARRIRHEYDLRLACIEPFQLVSPAGLAAAYGRERIVTGHGSDPITSLWLHLDPEAVRLDLVEPPERETFGLNLRGTSQVALGDVAGHIYFDYLEVAPNGVIGDVTIFDAEAGRRILDQIVERGIEFVRIFKTHDTRIKRDE